jgi:hypothetical protein
MAVTTLSTDTTFASDTTFGAGDILRFDPAVSVTVTMNNSNLIIEDGAVLEMRPANAGITHMIRWTNVNEGNFVGGGMQVGDPSALPSWGWASCPKANKLVMGLLDDSRRLSVSRNAQAVLDGVPGRQMNAKD